MTVLADLFLLAVLVVGLSFVRRHLRKFPETPLAVRPRPPAGSGATPMPAALDEPGGLGVADSPESVTLRGRTITRKGAWT